MSAAAALHGMRRARLDLVALVREAIDAEPYRIGPRMTKLKRLLAA